MGQGCSEPGIQIPITGHADTGLTICIAAALTLLFLGGHHGLRQIVAVLAAQDAAALAVFPEEAFAADLGPVGIVPDPVDQNDFSVRFFAHFDILLGCDPSPGKSGNDKSPVVKVSHHRAM